ncbi:uncharacterized protein LOC143196679 [Rhynchophorus ferrugineus]|uniref:uncharacterized protein LOC143196679 n=1 Tax=Rhynchophorus ferrugineus TaxID=354439 RepID=UPI003FCDDCB6
MTFSKIVLALFCIVLYCVQADSQKKLDRQKRTLIFGDLSVLQLILGYATPVADLLMPSTSIGFFVRGLYYVPINATDYTAAEFAEITRKFAPMSRWDLYRALEKDSDLKGQGGRICVLRSICEAAEIPIDRYHGFFEEIFHLIFTPTSTKENISQHTDNEYFAAYHLGKKNPGKCKQLFPDCKFTYLDLFTQFINIFDND